MISIDTNVLLRYLLQDEPTQSKKANKIFAEVRNILITDIVLVETVWTLKGKKYKLSKSKILAVIEGLFKERNINFEDSQTVWRALNNLRATKAIKIGSKKKDADFTDVLIIEKSKFVCKRKKAPFQGLFSFDLAAQQIDGIKNP